MGVSSSRSFLIALLLLVGIMSNAVASDSDNYSGIQYSIIDYEEAILGGTLALEPSALVGRMGSFINRYLALEARIGFGVSDNKARAVGNDASLGSFEGTLGADVESLLGVYALGDIAISSRSSVYGVIGITSIDVGKTRLLTVNNTDTVSSETSSTENGLSYGFGTSIGISGETSLNVEYMSYLDKSDFIVKSLNLGVLFNF